MKQKSVLPNKNNAIVFVHPKKWRNQIRKDSYKIWMVYMMVILRRVLDFSHQEALCTEAMNTEWFIKYVNVKFTYTIALCKTSDCYISSWIDITAGIFFTFFELTYLQYVALQ